MFVHLRWRGTYSMLEWIGSNLAILQRAKELWQPAIALTDFNGVYGVVDFYSKAKTVDIQPLLGVELPYIPQTIMLWKDKNTILTTGTLTILALSETGYHNLLAIVSQAYDNAHYDIPCVDNATLAAHREDILVLAGGIGSYFYQSVAMNHDEEILITHLQELQDIVGKDHFVVDITAQSFDFYPVLKSLHSLLLSYALQHELLIVTSSGFTYPYQDQKIAYETALAIKDNKRTYDPDARKIQWAYHILSEDEVRTILLNNGYDWSDVELWMSNTLKVAEMSHVKIVLGQSLFPNYPVPQEIQDLYDKYKDNLIQE